MTTEIHERDIVATEEMIRNLRAGTFRKIATGSAAVPLSAGGCVAAGLGRQVGQRSGGAKGGAAAHANPDCQARQRHSEAG